MQVQLVTPLSGSQQGASRPSIDGGRSSMDSARLRSSSPVVFPDDPPQAGVDTSSASGKERRRMSSSSIDPPSIPRGTLDRSFSMSSTVSDASSGAASASFHAPQPGHGAGPAAALQRSSRVMPLYNLSFHAILPTTITDAGTDQRVAKVSKKGHIELDGFGVLEPHELVIGVSDLATLHRATLAANVVAATTVAPAADTAAAVQGEGQPLHNIAPPQRSSMLDTTDSSTFSTSNGSKSIPSGVIPAPCSAKQSASAAAGPGTVEPPTGFQATAPEAKAFDGDKIGAKLIRGIKRLSLASQSKSQGQQQQQQQQPQSPHGSHGILSPASSLVSIVSQGSRLRTSLDVTSHAQVLAENISLASRGATLLSGVTVATDSLPMVPLERKPGQKRAEGYYWTVRKWTRKLDEQLHHSGAECEARRHAKPTESAAAQQLDGFGPGQNEILTKVWKRFNLVNRMGGSEVHPDVRSIPFRLEWTRDTQRIHRRRATEEARAAAQAGIVPRRTPSQLRGGGGDNSSNRPGSRHNSTTLRPALIPNTLHGSRPSSMHGGSQAAAEVSSVSGSSAIDHGDRSRGTEEDSSLDHDRSIPTYDDDDESDPEDSETPWSCHLVLGPQTRIPIGTLVPVSSTERSFIISEHSEMTANVPFFSTVHTGPAPSRSHRAARHPVPAAGPANLGSGCRRRRPDARRAKGHHQCHCPPPCCTRIVRRLGKKEGQEVGRLSCPDASRLLRIVPSRKLGRCTSDCLALALDTPLLTHPSCIIDSTVTQEK
ncbi:hypothetical protein K437DRAFT_151613 [Tilletiaria anomala UBC 951]|uniref:Uncharacterized protein n=1 Tax=Tilletiaria anomala (strain ATCC 24038 / CBS 436.72 / UBC 951) TaxID=1037660 RepID=A0A066VYD3_TILAU|nr:uncharacterized protein K437DRAFT_151613 [Tilletiaria anomala UBC 951]KDN43550.1 hypothetical protein K437DRAFT_151613 [Tilletiaria anomala UBC 951]